MIRQAGPKDAPAMEAFLQTYASTSMFLRGNLAAHGTCDDQHPHGTTFYLHDDNNGIAAIAGRTNGGYLMCQAPDNSPAFFAALASELHGQTIAGMTGAPTQVDALLTSLGCADQEFARRDIQPLYEINVSNLDVTNFSAGSLRDPILDDAVWLTHWFDGYHVDTSVPIPDGTDLGGLAARFIDSSDTRLLIVDDVAVAMTALNARVHDTVQIGGVYVPPEYRGRGYGGHIVALHLDALKRQGITKAILFAASVYAARAYELIGFEHIGSYEIALLKEPYQIGALA